jgi:hypothetical protein
MDQIETLKASEGYSPGLYDNDLHSDALKISSRLALNGVSSDVIYTGGGFWHCVVSSPATTRQIVVMADSVTIYNNEEWNDQFATLWLGEEDGSLTEDALRVIVEVVRNSMWLIRKEGN